MKRSILCLVLLAAFAPVLAEAESRADVSIDFFYSNLGNDGSWVDIGDYGYGWQPGIAATNRNWRPYADGYWAYTDVGWTWVSYEDFGWATYHYGRWTRVRDRGWFWIPGREWAPAWVSWRTGGEYVGWAPLPPRDGGELVYEGRPVNGAVDLDYDIGPENYNFVDVRYIGEPVLRDRIFDVSQNYGYVTQTVNVTNISYRDSQVCNYGPDYNTLSAYSSRPIQRLILQRDLSADLRAAAQNGGLTRVQGDRLLVAAPQSIQKSSTPLAPKLVKEKIGKPVIDRGWTKNREGRDEQELKEKIKAQDSKNIPPTKIAPRGESAARGSDAPEAKSAQGEKALPPDVPTPPVDKKHSAPVVDQMANDVGRLNDRRGKEGKHQRAGSEALEERPKRTQPHEGKTGDEQNERGKRERSRDAVPESTHEQRDFGAPELHGKHQREPQSAPPTDPRGGEYLQRAPQGRSPSSEGGEKGQGRGGKRIKASKSPAAPRESNDRLKQLRDLHGIERRAFQQLIAGNPKGNSVV